MDFEDLVGFGKCSSPIERSALQSRADLIVLVDQQARMRTEPFSICSNDPDLAFRRCYDVTQTSDCGLHPCGWPSPSRSPTMSACHRRTKSHGDF